MESRGYKRPSGQEKYGQWPDQLVILVELAGQYDQDYKVVKKVDRQIGLVLAVWPLGCYNL